MPKKRCPPYYAGLEADKKKAKKVKEVVEGGQIQSGYYQLPQIKEDVNRFILFKTSKKGGATLIYIEGELGSRRSGNHVVYEKELIHKIMNMKQLIVLLGILVSLTGYAQENARQDTTLLLNGRKIVIERARWKSKSETLRRIIAWRYD